MIKHGSYYAAKYASPLATVAKHVGKNTEKAVESAKQVAQRLKDSVDVDKLHPRQFGDYSERPLTYRDL